MLSQVSTTRPQPSLTLSQSQPSRTNATNLHHCLFLTQTPILSLLFSLTQSLGNLLSSSVLGFLAAAAPISSSLGLLVRFLDQALGSWVFLLGFRSFQSGFVGFFGLFDLDFWVIDGSVLGACWLVNLHLHLVGFEN